MSKTRMFILLFLVVSCLRSLSQVYPVQLSVGASLPCTAELSGFANPLVNDFMQLHISPLDMTLSERLVRLRVALEGQGINVVSKTVLQGVSALYLNGGENLQLSGADLSPYFEFQNLNNISQNTYRQMLPQGHYYLRFELYDELSGQKISNTATTLLFLMINEPPQWLSPEADSKFSPDGPLNIIFQWIPLHTTASGVEYLFQMVEILDGSDGNMAFLSHPVFYEETTTQTMLVYGIDKPALLPGHRYAFRVKATATKNGEPVALFKNGGNSEVRSFSYGTPCPPVEGLRVENTEPTRFDVVWDSDFGHESYRVNYRLQGTLSDPLWVETPGGMATIGGLAPDRSYQVWVDGQCPYGLSNSSLPVMVQTPSLGNYQVQGCGIPVAAEGLESGSGLAQLWANDVFLAYDFPVRVTKATGSNGCFSGEGVIQIPFLGGGRPGIRVKFNNIVINSAYRMVYGCVKTTYDPHPSNVVNLNEVMEGGQEVGNILSGNTDPEVVVESGEILVDNEGNVTGIEVDTASNRITITAQNENGQQTTRTENGNEYNQGDGIVTIIDAGGNLFVVDTDSGVVSSIGKLSEDGKKILASFDPYVIRNDLGIVDFERHPQEKWAFDSPNETYAQSLLLYQNEYETIDHYEGDGVYRACVQLIGAGSTAKVKARLREGTIDEGDLVFITQEGMLVKPERVGDEMNLELPAGCSGDGYRLYVLHREANLYRQVGQLQVVSYAKKNPEVVLVPVGMGKEDIDLEAVKQELDRIYAPLNVELDVTVADSVYTKTGWDQNQNGVVDVNGDEWFREYSQEQQALIEDYKEYLEQYYNYSEETKTAFIFVFGDTPEGAGGMVRKGDMPIGHQWGFIFGGMDSRTLAHELGHGLFTLRHTFDKDYGLEAQSTDNLMDYAGGSELIKYQWDILHDPARLGAPFQRDREGAANNPVMLPEDVLAILDSIRHSNISCRDIMELSDFVLSKGVCLDLNLGLFKLDYLNIQLFGEMNSTDLFGNKGGYQQLFINPSDYEVTNADNTFEGWEQGEEEPVVMFRFPRYKRTTEGGYDKMEEFGIKIMVYDWQKKNLDNYLKGDDIERIELTEEIMQNIFPATKADIIKKVTNAINSYKDHFEINTLERLSHFIGQIGHETGGLNLLEESSNYTSSTVIVKTWPFARFGHLYKKAQFNSETLEYEYTSVDFNINKCIDNPYYSCTFKEGKDYTLNEGMSEELNDVFPYNNSNEVINAFGSEKTVLDSVLRDGKYKRYRKFPKALRTDLNVSNLTAIIDDTYKDGWIRLKSDYYPKKKELFDVVYACRMGNGDIASKDGSTFKGAGMIHLTGKYNYYLLSRMWNNDPINQADKKYFHKHKKDGGHIHELKENYDVAVKASMYFWISNNLNFYADKGFSDTDIDKVGSIINGTKKPKGEEERRYLTKLVKNNLKLQ